ncbi:uncharacterized protein LOC135488364 [Lineus longissimus]|uniref:uncharacterized protein LOC135488364 n=1 Tax=Lineus longissimus TaxID=88925 RepID=UPI002B4D775C
MPIEHEAKVRVQGENAPLLPIHRRKSLKPTSVCEDLTFDCIIARLYLNPCLLHQEQTSRVPKESALPRKVQAIKDLIVKNLENGTDQGQSDLNSFAGGKLSLCGSVAEGTKVCGADEFDFQYLMSVDGLEATKKRLIRTKPRSANHESCSFFSLRVHDSDGTTEELNPATIHDRFLHRIKQLLSNTLEDFKMKKAGPAVKIWYEDDDGRTIKIDLTLGLKADNKNIAHLTPLAKSLESEGRFKCHYVAAHDYWKICFVDTEQTLLREIIEADEIKGSVYRIIKLLRDESDIKDPYGDGILPSYPIKVTFLDIAYQDHTRGITWSIQDVTFHVIRILREVERRGLSHSLCSLFLDGDDVMSEADRSYLESRRLLKELKAKARFNVSQRRKRVCFMTLLMASMLSYLLLSVLVQRKYRKLLKYAGFFPLFFALFCLESIQLLLQKSERMYKLYPFWPLSCLLCVIFQHLPSYVGGMLDSSSRLYKVLWLSYDSASFLLGLILYVVVFYHSCYGLYKKKSFFILDASALYLNVIFPYKWISPSGKSIPYIPEIGIFNLMMKLIYMLSILLSSTTVLLGIMLFSVLISVRINLISRSNPTVTAIIGQEGSVLEISLMLIPAGVGMVIYVLSLMSLFYQSRILKNYTDKLSGNSL